jgi:iron uptake system component EfeO
MTNRNVLFCTLVTLSFGAAACSSSPKSTGKTDADYKNEVTTGMHDAIATELSNLHQAALDLKAAAPTPTGRGWDATQDAAAFDAMKAAWQRARTAYEHVEGAVAPIFPDIDTSIDARYDDFLTALHGDGDAAPFDDQGVTGMHAIERILYVRETPQKTVDFEKSLPGYRAAAFPATELEAADFKNKLAARLVTDVETLLAQWQPAKIDLGSAFQGLIALMNEQREKVNKAATGEEESRYSQRTLADLRGNLTGTESIYAIFRPWVLSKTNAGDATKDGPASDAAIARGFQSLHASYDADPGDAVPSPPATWSSQAPASADLATPFGQLFSAVLAAVDPTKTGSVVDEMNGEARLLGFPQFVEGP